MWEDERRGNLLGLNNETPDEEEPDTQVSAISGSGTGDLLDHLVAHMKEDQGAEGVEPDSGLVSVAIVGRPNVGKSSLVNAITGVGDNGVFRVQDTGREVFD